MHSGGFGQERNSIRRVAVPTPAATWSCDLATEALTWDDGVFDIFGLPRGIRIDRQEAVTFYCDESRETMEWLRAGAIATRRGFSMDADIARPDGTRCRMRLIAHVACEMGRPVRLHGTKQDVSGELQAIEARRSAAEHDPLTGLLNQDGFTRRFLGRPEADPAFVPLGALLLVEVSNLAGINRRLGVEAGDACLRTVAARLSIALPERAVAARIAGGLFALLLPAEPARILLDRRVTALLRDAAMVMPWNGAPLAFVLASGIARPANPMAYDAESLLMAARLDLGGRLG